MTDQRTRVHFAWRQKDRRVSMFDNLFIVSLAIVFNKDYILMKLQSPDMDRQWMSVVDLVNILPYKTIYIYILRHCSISIFGN